MFFTFTSLPSIFSEYGFSSPLPIPTHSPTVSVAVSPAFFNPSNSLVNNPLVALTSSLGTPKASIWSSKAVLCRLRFSF